MQLTKRMKKKTMIKKRTEHGLVTKILMEAPRPTLIMYIIHSPEVGVCNVGPLVDVRPFIFSFIIFSFFHY